MVSGAVIVDGVTDWLVGSVCGDVIEVDDGGVAAPNEGLVLGRVNR